MLTENTVLISTLGSLSHVKVKAESVYEQKGPAGHRSALVLVA